jgi:hypothetical protein
MFRSIRPQLNLTFVVLLCFVAGCGPPQHPIVGTWSGTAPGPGGEDGTMVITFNADGTMKQTLKAGSKVYEITGTYTALDGRLTQTLKSVSIDGKSDAPPNATRDMGYAVNGPELLLGVSMAQNVKLKKVE